MCFPNVDQNTGDSFESLIHFVVLNCSKIGWCHAGDESLSTAYNYYVSKPMVLSYHWMMISLVDCAINSLNNWGLESNTLGNMTPC